MASTDILPVRLLIVILLLVGRILDSAMDAIITLDSDQCVILFNPVAEHIFHCTAAEIQGQPLTQLWIQLNLPCGSRTVWPRGVWTSHLALMPSGVSHFGTRIALSFA